MALSTSAGNGSITSQTNTQTPQSSTAPATNAAPARQVQTGTASQLLTSSGGISLTSRPLPTVTVSGTTTTGQAAKDTAQPAPAKHHISPVAAGLVIVLVVIALVSVWLIHRSAKNTTHS